jgi:hypothetical protein
LILFAAIETAAQRPDRLASFDPPNPDNKHYALKVYAYVLCDGAGGGCESIESIKPYLEEAFTYFDDHRIHPYLACLEIIASNTYYLDPNLVGVDSQYEHEDGVTVVIVNTGHGGLIGFAPGGSQSHFCWAIKYDSRTTAHEMGHVLGLEHTFESTSFWCNNSTLSNLAELANGDECHLRGDYTCDTPPDVIGTLDYISDCEGRINGCLDPDDNPYNSIVPRNNIMGYRSPLNNDTSCPFEFTAGQGLRMRTALENLSGFNNYYQLNTTIIRNDGSPEHVISANATLSGTILCYNNILIESETEVTVNGVIKMAKGRRIKVKPEAKLVVNGQLTSLDEGVCEAADGGMWQGVQLLPVGQSFLPHGAECYLNNAKISNAVYAIDVPLHLSFLYKSPKLEATNTLFYNNAISVNAFSLFATTLTGGGLDFTNCTFDVNEDFMGDYDFQSHAFLVGGPNSNFYACEFKQSLYPKEALSQYQVALHVVSTNVTVDHKYLPCPSNVQCDVSGYFTKSSRFDNFGKGVLARSIGSLQPITIRNTVFKNCTLNGVETVNILTPQLTHNRVVIEAQNTVGFQITSTVLYEIQNNEFLTSQEANGVTVGIGVLAPNSSMTPMNNLIQNNKFTGLYNANYAHGLNGFGDMGLEYRCNQNYSSLQNDFFILNTPNGIKINQGSVNEAAGNIFSNPADNHGHINIANNGSKVNYHALNVQGEFPTKINPDRVEVIQTTEENGTCSEVFGPQESDQAEVLQPFTHYEDLYWQLRGVYDSLTTIVQGQLDDGNTGTLIGQIEFATSLDTSTILATLSSDSPWVSAEVLGSLFLRNDLFTTEQIVDICVLNPDAISEEPVWSMIYSGSYGVDSIHLSQLLVSTGTVTARSELKAAMHTARIQSDNCVFHILRYLSTPDSVMDYNLVRTWLERMDYLETDLATVWTYMAEGDWASAASRCQQGSSLVNDYAIYEWAQMEEFVDIMSAGLVDSIDLSSLDSLFELELLDFTTEVKPGTRANTMAQTILDIYYGHSPTASSFRAPVTSHRKTSQGSKIKDFLSEVNLIIQPNPAHGTVQIDLKSDQPCLLRGTDINGRIILELNNYQSNEPLDIQQLSKGIYFIQAIQLDGTVRTGKLLVK